MEMKFNMASLYALVLFFDAMEAGVVISIT